MVVGNQRAQTCKAVFPAYQEGRAVMWGTRNTSHGWHGHPHSAPYQRLISLWQQSGSTPVRKGW